MSTDVTCRTSPAAFFPGNVWKRIFIHLCLRDRARLEIISAQFYKLMPYTNIGIINIDEFANSKTTRNVEDMLLSLWKKKHVHEKPVYIRGIETNQEQNLTASSILLLSKLVPCMEEINCEECPTLLRWVMAGSFAQLQRFCYYSTSGVIDEFVAENFGYGVPNLIQLECVGWMPTLMPDSLKVLRILSSRMPVDLEHLMHCTCLEHIEIRVTDIIPRRKRNVPSFPKLLSLAMDTVAYEKCITILQTNSATITNLQLWNINLSAAAGTSIVLPNLQHLDVAGNCVGKLTFLRKCFAAQLRHYVSWNNIVYYCKNNSFDQVWISEWMLQPLQAYHTWKLPDNPEKMAELLYQVPYLAIKELLLLVTIQQPDPFKPTQHRLVVNYVQCERENIEAVVIKQLTDREFLFFIGSKVDVAMPNYVTLEALQLHVTRNWHLGQ